MHLASPLGFSPFNLHSQLAALSLNPHGGSRTQHGDTTGSHVYTSAMGADKLFGSLMRTPLLPPAFSSEANSYGNRRQRKEEPFPFTMAGTALSKVSLGSAFSSTLSSPASSERGEDSYSCHTKPARMPSPEIVRHNSRPSNYQFSQEEVFARKVFVGGLPIDVSEEEIWQTFHVFGNVLVDWPRRPEGNHAREEECGTGKSARSMTGYVFLVFEEERSVQSLVSECHKEGERYYLFVSSPTMRNKPVQVRPWRLSDMDYMLDPSMPLDPRRTVFIGGVPRPTKANELAECLNRLYGPVCYVGIDIDPELKYPKGAARVTFTTTQGFISAITGRFVHVHHADNQKRVEIKPYVMDEQMCDECQGKQCLSRYAPYFCGDVGCLQYYCESCWDKVHVRPGKRADHRPLVRMGDQTKMLPRPPHHNGHSRGGPRHGYSRNYGSSSF